MSKLLKKRMMDQVKTDMRSVDSFILFGFHKMNADQAYGLRKQLREKAISVRIVKNTLAAVAFQEIYRKDLHGVMQGPTAIAYGGESPVDVAKMLIEWNRKGRVLDIKGGFLGGQVLGKKDVENLSRIPPKPVLLSMMAGAFGSPLSKVASIMKASTRDLGCALNALAEKMEKTEKQGNS